MSTSTTTSAHRMEEGRVASGGGLDADDNTGAWIFIGLNCAVYLLLSMVCVAAVFCDRPAQLVVVCCCLLCAVFYACVRIVTRLLITDPAAARVGGNALDLFRVFWWIVDACAVAVRRSGHGRRRRNAGHVRGRVLRRRAPRLVRRRVRAHKVFLVFQILRCLMVYVVVIPPVFSSTDFAVCRNYAEVASSATEDERANSRVQVKVMTSTMAPNTGHEPANDDGVRSGGRETATSSIQQQKLDCESLCALLGSVLAMVLVPVLLLQTLATYGDKPAQLMLELSSVLSVVFYLWSFFVTRVLTKAEESGCRLDRETLLHVFLCATGAGVPAALGGVMIGVVAAMFVMYITSLFIAGLFGWCLGEYLRTCRYSATGWPILQIGFISNH
jgi:hypothetical protein